MVAPTPVQGGIIHEWLGPPEELIGYIIVFLVGKAGWEAIEHFLGGGRRRRPGLTVIQESGPGGVQESE